MLLLKTHLFTLAMCVLSLSVQGATSFVYLPSVMPSDKKTLISCLLMPVFQFHMPGRKVEPLQH